MENLMIKYVCKSIAISLLMSVSLAAYAHVDDAQNGFMAGLLHPIFGLDHFLAMLSVGILSAQIGGRFIYQVPISFVVFMTAGAAIGLFKFAISFMEVGIAISVVLFGFAILFAKHRQILIPIIIGVASFGFLHGYAHGLEMPKASDPVYYGGGFLISTIAIHILGVGIGYVFTAREVTGKVLQLIGSAMACTGIAILIKGFI
jgi:urease accessory protein